MKKTTGIHLSRIATGPGPAGQPFAASGGEDESTEYERRQHRVVVPTTCEVDGEEGVPADQGSGAGAVPRKPRGQYRARKDTGRSEHLEDPGRHSRRRPGNERDELREESEARPVHRGRLAPRRPGILVSRIGAELARRVDIGIATVHGRDPPVLPVGPGIGREEQGPAERHNLDRERQEQDGAQPGRLPPQQRQRGEIDRERRDEEGEEDDAELAASGATRIRRDERSALDPCAGDTTRDEQSDRSRREERGAAHLSGAGLGGRRGRLCGRRRLGRRRRWRRWWWWRRGRRRGRLRQRTGGRRRVGDGRAGRCLGRPGRPGRLGRRRHCPRRRSSRRSARTDRARTSSTPASPSAPETTPARADRSPSS